jgi:hypothetical protein
MSVLGPLLLNFSHLQFVNLGYKLEHCPRLALPASFNVGKARSLTRVDRVDRVNIRLGWKAFQGQAL